MFHNKTENNDFLLFSFNFRVRDELETLHKYLTLAQVTATLFILCTCLFLVSTVGIISIRPSSFCLLMTVLQTKNVKQLVAEMVYMVAMCFQLVLYCWFGNEVTREVKKLKNFDK